MPFDHPLEPRPWLLPQNVSEMIEPHVVIPLIGGAQVTLSGAFPLTEEQWDGLLMVLHVMKPGLVVDPEAEFAEAIQARKDAAMRPVGWEAEVEAETPAVGP